MNVAVDQFLRVASTLLTPADDLFDGAGNFNPRVDGVDDSLSFGVGSTAVGAVLDLP